ncbi:MAG: hypothetical protein IT581_06965 [Verrucomicrobiales bacterium]|nr:hypothetical protein [Verrucomicrobiales bacterium]
MGDDERCEVADGGIEGSDPTQGLVCVDDHRQVAAPPPQQPVEPYRMRRGPGTPNPIQPPTLRLWRGTGEGVEPTAHSERVLVHDFGPGRNGAAPLYFATEYRLAEQYSRLQGRGGADRRPIVYLWEGSWSELSRSVGRDVRVLDLTSGELGQQWSEFVNQRTGSLTRLQLMRWSVGDNNAYWPFFEEFLRRTNRALEDYDVVIGPEVLRNGTQVCIRDPRIQDAIRLRWVEYVHAPLWVRVVDARGTPIDVDVNHPETGEENIRFVNQRIEALRSREERSEPAPGRPSPQPGRPRGPIIGPRVRGATAGILAALEVARIVMDLVEAYRSAPSELQTKLHGPLRKYRFWRDHGVDSVIAALVTGGEVPSRQGGPNESAEGRLIYGIVPSDWEQFDVSDLEFFLAIIDSIRRPPSDNPLDQGLTDASKLIRFLKEGWVSRAILPTEESADSTLPMTRWNWYAMMQRPEHDGSTVLTDSTFDLTRVISRIRETTQRSEQVLIERISSLATPARMADREPHTDWSLPLDKSKTWSYRTRSNRPFYSVTGAADEIGDEDEWGNIEPRFYQVGDDGNFDPFMLATAKLVTGADVATNEILWSCLSRHDPRALIQDYQPTLTGSGPPSSWVALPMVYVDAADVH